MKRTSVSRTLEFLCVGMIVVTAARADTDPPEIFCPPPVTLEKVAIEPGSPGPESLVKLTVTLANGGEEPITAFGFDVEVAGQKLPVYDNQLFLAELAAGETLELPLYNFWTSETGRPAPADGKLPVKVTLREARWLKVGEEEGTDVWTLEGPVEGLPVSAETVVKLAK